MWGSFKSKYYKNKGIPIGNLTSQIFSNIYLNELDRFIKHELKVKRFEIFRGLRHIVDDDFGKKFKTSEIFARGV